MINGTHSWIYVHVSAYIHSVINSHTHWYVKNMSIDTFIDLCTYQWMCALICQWYIIDISMPNSIDIPMHTPMDIFLNIYTYQRTYPLIYQWTHSWTCAYISAYIHCVVTGYTHGYTSVGMFIDLLMDISLWYQCTYQLKEQSAHSWI